MTDEQAKVVAKILVALASLPASERLGLLALVAKILIEKPEWIRLVAAAAGKEVNDVRG